MHPALQIEKFGERPAGASRNREHFISVVTSGIIGDCDVRARRGTSIFLQLSLSISGFGYRLPKPVGQIMLTTSN